VLFSAHVVEPEDALDVNFQEVVHSVLAWDADVAKQPRKRASAA